MRRQTTAIFVLLGLLAVFVVQGSTEDTGSTPTADNAPAASNGTAAPLSTANETSADPAGTPEQAAEATVSSFTSIHSIFAASAVVLAHAL
ncbi:MS Related Protein [Caenorhabditis elegans]|uniref:MS Related Protein n=1 Tax=Caenorhabditis elegans TaxID=6239 RepID=O16596_CAEEL|nr:MS Related Protein [Caenorhabditis elegans]CCD68440.1 MS Related Protein [Caenorhabditis elegans]|eukprot:NP_494307.1 MS Related Protein [Caenorhabditis elegans]